MGAITVYVEVISPYVVQGEALPCDESRAHTHGAWSFDTVVTVTGPHGVKGRSNCAVGTVAGIAPGILIRERRARFALSEAATSAPASTSDWVGADRRAEQRENFDRLHLPGRCHVMHTFGFTFSRSTAIGMKRTPSEYVS
jgi:hypothetical protein